MAEDEFPTEFLPPQIWQEKSWHFWFLGKPSGETRTMKGLRKVVDDARKGRIKGQEPATLPLGLLGLADALTHEGRLEEAARHLDEAAVLLHGLGGHWVAMGDETKKDADRLRAEMKEDPNQIVIDFKKPPEEPPKSAPPEPR